VLSRMTDDELGQFFALVARAHGAATTTTRGPRADVAWLISRLSSTDAAAYLDALRRRRSAGEPLIQKPVPH
jgi:hypothetical protein